MQICLLSNQIPPKTPFPPIVAHVSATFSPVNTMSPVVRKLAVLHNYAAYCKNKGADNCRVTALLISAFVFATDSPIPLLPNSGISSLWASSVVLSNLVGNTEDSFSRNVATMLKIAH